MTNPYKWNVFGAVLDAQHRTLWRQVNLATEQQAYSQLITPWLDIEDSVMQPLGSIVQPGERWLWWSDLPLLLR